MSCRVLGKLCKRTGEVLSVPISLTEFCERRWFARGIVSLGLTLRPSPEHQQGFEWRCTQAGQCGTVEPFSLETQSQPFIIGDEVNDGSAKWVAQAISNDSLARTIADVEWSSTAMGLSFTGENIVNTGGQQLCGAYATGAPAPGNYRINALVTFDAGAETFAFDLKVPA